MKVEIKEIKQQSENEDYLNIGEYSYRVINKSDIEQSIKDWFDNFGGTLDLITYEFDNYLDFAPKFEKVICDLKVDIIKNKSLFLKDARDYVNREYEECKSEYKNYEDFLKQQFGLSVNDLSIPIKMWDQEVLYTGHPKNFKSEMMPNIKQYEINEEAIAQSLVDNNIFTDYDTLGDYGIKGKFILENHIVYKIDI